MKTVKRQSVVCCAVVRCRTIHVAWVLALALVIYGLLAIGYMQTPTRCHQDLLSVPRNEVTHDEYYKSAIAASPFVPWTYIADRSLYKNVSSAMERLNKLNVRQDNPELLHIIRNYYIDQPSIRPYNLTYPDRREFSWGQAAFVDSRLNYMEGGFYVESGALNGEKGSNSLFFEKVRKWNGLLVEPNPSNYAMLKNTNRKAFSINACLNPDIYPKAVRFWKAFNVGKIVKSDTEEKKYGSASVSTVQCFPLYSILLALNQTTVDFLSLDIEGDELRVLETIPFSKVDIRMLAVEYAHGGGTRVLENFMKKNGYETMLNMIRDDGGVKDLIFRKNTVFKYTM